ncbi:MAG: hypothetical protein ABI158_12905 [Edaphobacter sp.]
MKFPGKPVPRSAAILALACLIASISGCASPGPARPPSLHLPRLVTDLAAKREGEDVTLRWTTPDKTTDGLKVQPVLTAEICRELPSSTCTPIKRLAVHPGPSEALETLPASLTTDSATLLIYRVQIFNAKGRSAGLSSPAFAAAGAAPPAVEHLQVKPVREGAMIEWQPQPAPSFVELDRTLIQTTAPHKPSAKQPLQLTPSIPAEIYLRTGKQSSDPGGTIDPTAQRGETYRYTARRVRAIVLDGHRLELRSVPSPAITAVMRDTFPPKAPTGLAAIPGSHAIDLSWEPNTESDLAGYIVYRQQIAANGRTIGAPARLTSNPNAGPAFSDGTAKPGQTYSYRITAIDTAGNESPVSNEVQESLGNQ